MDEAQQMWEKKIIPNWVDGKDENNENMSEKAILLQHNQQVVDKTAARLRMAAIILSWISVISAFGLGIVATFFACESDSQSMLSFGLDALLDSFSSMVILWRFYGSVVNSEEKEKIACGILGVLFLISFGSLASKSIFALVVHETMEGLTVTVAIVNGIICSILGFTKIYVGFKLDSRALRTDSAITLTGAVLSFMGLISIEVYHLNENLWYLDDIFGLTCSLFFLVYGLWVLWTVLRK
ncbi:hypothetical protein ACJMK2_026683 [Sinanodonta woodiana]|uniref:Transmembrane protein 163 n=1 Tax=Sinanodonta woodiana TaxID=1069815 RepID=A0ABD3XKB9_SINWO